MALIAVRNKQTKKIAHVSEGWLERWPDDYERVVRKDPDKPDPKRRPRARKKPEAKQPPVE